MDEKKRKELEALRKQLDPEVLKRVAQAMGADPGAVAASVPPKITPSAPQTSSKRPPPPPTKKAIQERQMRELQNRIRRREQEIDAHRGEDVKKIAASFVVYDTNHFRGKQIGGYFTRMEFSHLTTVSDPAGLVKAVIERLNDTNIIRTCYIVSDEILADFITMLNSAGLKAVREKIPGLAKLPIFVVIPAGKPPLAPKGFDPNFVISMTHNASFSAKKVKAALHIKA